MKWQLWDVDQRQDWYKSRYRSLHLFICWTVCVYCILLQLFLSPGPS